MTAVDGETAVQASLARGRERALAPRVTVALAGAAIAASTVLRFVIGAGQPLWLDETWTGAIAGTTGFSAFWRQVYLDVNAPLYYLVMHLWQGVFGLSDASLRLPSAIFGAAAPLLVAFTGVKGLSRPARLTWAALIALWIPGIWFSGDARCYALLLLLTTAQTLAFVRLLHAPDLRRASAWCVLAALAILTHYHAAILVGLEGLAYLALARRQAVRTWPAALAFAPAAVWLAWHLPRIAAFVGPGVAWYPPLRWNRLGRLANYVTGAQDLSFALIGVGVVALALGLMTARRTQRAPRRPTVPLWVAVVAAAVGAILVVVMGFLRPSFTDRYLIPFEPGLLLGIALIAQTLTRRFAWTHAMAVVAVVVVAGLWADRELRHGFRFYNWEVASQDLMRAKPVRLVYLWDHPASRILAADQLERTGGFFFTRAHQPVEVRAVVVRADQDPNPVLLAQAAAPGSAILWAYDIGVRGTAAIRHRPRIETLDPSFKCRDYARGSVGVVACDRAGSVETRP
ncbi:MAG TPA: glycosyltransferase family 39 protein [Caulobacteraceae bacterium]|jgi:uncharacterized membrane protein|nr:glycosyltransferase family 39 protein [Caulobacteraceae bacterium]